MSGVHSRRWAACVAGCGAVLFSIREALACAVCFGDPESAMAQGAVAGVLVLVGVVGFVLLGIVGTSLFWIHRGRRLGRMQQSTSSSGAHGLRNDP